jgi:hypothetical protein
MNDLIYKQRVTARVVEVTDEGHVLAEAVKADHDDPINFGPIQATPGDEIEATIKGHAGKFYAAYVYSDEFKPEDYEVHGKEAAKENVSERIQKQQDERKLERIRDQKEEFNGSNNTDTGPEGPNETDEETVRKLQGLAAKMGAEESTIQQSDDDS